MHLGWNIDWKVVSRDLLVVIAAILAALLLHFLFYTLLRRLHIRRGSLTANAIVIHTSRPVRLLLVLVAISIILPGFALPIGVRLPVRHILEIAFITDFAWLAVGFIETLQILVNQRLPADMQDDVRARRTRTQVQLLRQILIGITLFGALAASLMTFPDIRNIGAGLFASAGLAGLALGMAARPALGNLIAGIQIALTEPIRLDDVVIVEGETGRVAEVNTTYVVVRLLDLRHLVVPLSYFIEKPFQNLTRYSSDLIGAVLLYADYTVPVEALRGEYERILRTSALWDGKVARVQVTDAKESGIELRFLMSAANSSATFDLRCDVREKLIDYLHKNYSNSLPRVRSDVSLSK